MVNEKKQVGKYTIKWDGKDDAGIDVPSGLYYYRMVAHEFTKSSKMLLLK